MLYKFDFECVVICLALFVFVYCTTVTCFISSCPMTGFRTVSACACARAYVCTYVCMSVTALCPEPNEFSPHSHSNLKNGVINF